jgi:thiol-disulfide isomerase/thioredoxin
MKRFLGIFLGVIQVVFALVATLIVVRLSIGEDRPLLLGANNALFTGSLLVTILAAITSMLNGLRLVGVPQWKMLQWKALPGMSGVLALLVIGLMAADIRYTETRPISVAPVGKPFEMKFTAFDGSEVDISSMKGKVILVNFWATWCGPCKTELPYLQAAYKKWHAEGLEIIGISCDEKDTDLRSFLKANPLPWPNYFDGKGWHNPYVKKYQLRGIPQLWLIDKTGVLRDIDVSIYDVSGFDNMIKTRLQE